MTTVTDFHYNLDQRYARYSDDEMDPTAAATYDHKRFLVSFYSTALLHVDRNENDPESECTFARKSVADDVQEMFNFEMSSMLETGTSFINESLNFWKQADPTSDAPSKGAICCTHRPPFHAHTCTPDVKCMPISAFRRNHPMPMREFIFLIVQTLEFRLIKSQSHIGAIVFFENFRSQSSVLRVPKSVWPMMGNVFAVLSVRQGFRA